MTTDPQPELFTRDGEPAPVRDSDPETSKRAAAKAGASAETIRATALNLIAEFGPLTYDELIDLWPDAIPATPSGIRTRVAELRRDALVRRDATMGESKAGNPAARWRATPDGKLAAR